MGRLQSQSAAKGVPKTCSSKNTMTTIVASVSPARTRTDGLRRSNLSFIQDIALFSEARIQLAKNAGFGLIDQMAVLSEGALRLQPARVMQGG